MKKVVDKYKYIACDDRIFLNEEDCLEHEKKLRDLAKGKALVQDNPEIAVFIEDGLKNAISDARSLNAQSRQSCGYDTWIDNNIKAKAYDKLHEGIQKFLTNLKVK